MATTPMVDVLVMGDLAHPVRCGRRHIQGGDEEGAERRVMVGRPNGGTTIDTRFTANNTTKED